MSKKILLKVSGEMFSNSDGSSFDFAKYSAVAKNLVEFVEVNNAGLALVVGAGNIWRYRDTTGAGLGRVEADQLGMVATVFNAKLLEGAINNAGGRAMAMTAFDVPGLLPSYDFTVAKSIVEDGGIVILAGGTGNPFFTTDSCAVLRALELDLDMLVKATKVDGVYDADPVKNPKAKKYETVSYDEVLEKSLQVMDLPAISLARDNNLPILVFDYSDPENLLKVMKNFKLGTLVS
jgi:uridylate kinase